MVTLVKHEWHQVDAQFALELDESLLSEIYPDLDEEEIAEMLRQIADGEIDVETVCADARDNDVDIEWDRQYDDWWTDRKGGYEVTYELGDDDSWTTPDVPPSPTHKCTMCKWTGQSYDAEWQWQDDDGNTLDEAIKVCPMCDSEIELTVPRSNIAVDCFSCDEPVKESELIELSGKYLCPHCKEGWVMPDQRGDDTDEEECE